MTLRRRPTPAAPQAAPGTAVLEAAMLDDVAGHRVVRRIHTGTRAALFLAHPSFRRDGGTSTPRILKVFNAGTSPSSIDVELAALSATAIPHVTRLLDVSSMREGAPPCLIFERLPGPSLSTYLEQSSSLSAGQAVTILAPLCSTLQSLHDAGVTHGGIQPRRIVFDDRGSPTLTGFGRGVLRQAPQDHYSAAWPGGRVRANEGVDPRQAGWRDAVSSDHGDLLDVVDEVLAHVDADRMPAGFDLERSARAISEGPRRLFLVELERILFSLAPPQVVSLPVPDAESALHTHASPQRTDVEPAAAAAAESASYDWSPTRPPPEPAPSENRLIAALRVLGVSSTGLEFAASVVGVTARLTTRHAPQAPTPPTEEAVHARSASKRWRRRPLLVGAVCAVVATTGLLLVLPSPNDGAQAGGQKTSTPPASAPGPSSADADLPVNTDDDSALSGDDPAAALQTLSQMNDGCAAAAEPGACAATVFQEDYLAAQPSDAPSALIDAGGAVVTGSWGGSALVAARLNGQPASFLLLKGEAGWRIRDVFMSAQ